MNKELFDLIEQDARLLKGDDTSEVCLVAQFNKLCKSENLRGVQTRCKRFDVGNAKGLFLANEFYFNKKATSNS